MVLKQIVWLLTLLSMCQLPSEEIPLKTIDFFQLDAMLLETKSIPQKVAIKGFLYKSDSHDIILAAEPNLKSCCIGNSTKRNRQIIVIGDIPPSFLSQRKPVTLVGVLTIDPSRPFPAQLVTVNP